MSSQNEFVCVTLSDPAVDVEAMSEEDRKAFFETFDRSLLKVKANMALMEFHCTPLKVREAAVAPGRLLRDDSESYLVDVFLRHVKHISNLIPKFDKRDAIRDGHITEDWLDEGFIKPPMAAAAVATGIGAQIVRQSRLEEDQVKN